MVKKEKQLIVFPWIELMPFVLYVIAALYVAIPSNVFYQNGLQDLQDIGVYVIPSALIAGLTLAVIGFLVFHRLRRWRKTATLVLSICHTAVCAVAACGMAVFIFLLLTGKITQ